MIVIEPEGAENSGARDFNIKPVLVVDKAELGDFVDEEAFEAVVED